MPKVMPKVRLGIGFEYFKARRLTTNKETQQFQQGKPTFNSFQSPLVLPDYVSTRKRTWLAEICSVLVWYSAERSSGTRNIFADGRVLQVPPPRLNLQTGAQSAREKPTDFSQFRAPPLMCAQLQVDIHEYMEHTHTHTNAHTKVHTSQHLSRCVLPVDVPLPPQVPIELPGPFTGLSVVPDRLGVKSLPGSTFFSEKCGSLTHRWCCCMGTMTYRNTHTHTHTHTHIQNAFWNITS